jgi:hypothetical protein
VLAGVCPARGRGTGAPRTGIVWGITEQDLGARRPPNPFEREPSEGRVFRGSMAPGRLGQRPGNDLMIGSRTHRCAMG